MKAKETEKERLRALRTEEEDRLSSTYSSFVSEVKSLKELAKQIDEYLESNKVVDLDQLSNKAEAIVERMKSKQEEISALQPAMDEMAKAVADQESHKKNLKENIELIKSSQRILELDKEISVLEEEAESVEGHDTCNEDWERLAARKQELLNAQARLEGRRGEILESIRSFKASTKFANVTN